MRRLVMRRLVAFCLAVLIATSLLISAPNASSFENINVNVVAHMPKALYRASAVWDGTEALIFGGRDITNVFDHIIAYNPSMNAAFTMDSLLPTSTVTAPSIWDGENAFIFAGDSGPPIPLKLDRIVKYNPIVDEVTVMAAKLPSPRVGASGVWDGKNAYIFGGHNETSFLTEIVRYDTSSDTISLMSAKLRIGLAGTSAVWTGSGVYLFGGKYKSEIYDRILRFDPETDTIQLVNVTLPGARFHTSAIWDGESAYIFGGRGDSSTLDDIVRFTPSSNTVTLLSATLPSPRERTCAIWDGSSAYIFGGDSEFVALSEIVEFDPKGVEETSSGLFLPLLILAIIAVIISLILFNLKLRGNSD